ncbi:MAG TPA: IS5 family transposase [Opitutales bacterium]|nr:IS5 family transposase [Opitutales bacterium]
MSIQAAQTAIVDATIITAAVRPTRVIELEPGKDEQATDEQSTKTPVLEMAQARHSADADARWLKKGKQYFFGYRMHVVCDESGFVHGMHMTPANVAEVTQLQQAVGDMRPRRVLADKGYASKANRAMLRSVGIKNGVCYKEAACRPLSHWQRRFNSLVSKSRWVVEQVFGTTKRRFQFTRTRYMGLAKVEAEGFFKLIAYNGLKAIRRCCFDFSGRSLA